MEQESPAHSRWKKGIKISLKILFWTFSIFFLLIVSSLALIYFNKNKIIGYIKNELNQYLASPVFVDDKDIDITFLSTFPMVSIDFRNVSALDAPPFAKKDTLFKAGRIGLRFSTADLWNGNYTIRQMAFSNVKLKLKTDRKGNVNYNFIRPQKDTSGKTGAFRLEKFIMNDVDIYYSDKQKSQKHSLLINKASISGNFSESEFDVFSEGEMFVRVARIDSVTYLKDNAVKLDCEFHADSRSGTYTLSRTLLAIGKMRLDVSGVILKSKEDADVDIKLSGRDIDIASIISMLPENIREKSGGYESTGMMELSATVKGKFSSGSLPSVSAKFKVKDADIEKKGEEISLKNVSLEGTFSDQGKGKLAIPFFSADLAGGIISGHFNYSDFKSPHLDAAAKAKIDLGALIKFLPADTIKSARGSLTLDAVYKGPLRDPDALMSGEIKSAKASGSLKIGDAFFVLKNNPLTIDSVNADLTLNNNDVKINSFSGKLPGSDFHLKGMFRNMLAWLFLENEGLSIEASLKGNNLNLNEILKTDPPAENTSPGYELTLPDNIDVSFQTSIKNLVFRKFSARSVSGRIFLRDAVLSTPDLSFETMDGTVAIAGSVDNSEKSELVVRTNAFIDKVNVRKMFTQLENFGQTTLVDSHIDGVVTAKLELASEWNSGLQANLDKLTASCDLTIEKGELVGFEPMNSLSRFIKVEELRHIRFSTLKNTIRIANKEILIPKTEINSSALNITLSGTHNFENIIDYNVKILLSELLAKKAKAAKKENSEFGEEEEGEARKTALYLVMKGPIDDPSIKYSMKNAVKEIRENLANDWKEKSKLISRELARLRGDSTSFPEEPKKEQKLLIKWDGRNDKKEKKKDPPPPAEDDEDY